MSAASSIAFVTGALTGHRAAMVRRFVAAFGEPGSGRHIVHEAFPVAAPAVDLDTAGYIVSLGVELLESAPTTVRFASQLAELRQGRPGRRGKFVMVGPRLSLTAANADEWIPRTPDEVSGFAWEIANVLLRDDMHQARDLEGFDDLTSRASSVEPSPEAERIARELVEHGPAAFVGAGASFLNALVGRPEIEVDPLPFTPWSALEGDRESAVEVRTLQDALSEAPPDVVFVADTNPLYSETSDRFQEWLAGAGFRVAVSSFLDETAAACNVILAESMSFERFEDAVPAGIGYPVASLQAPLLARTLYDTRSMPDALIAIGKAAGQEDAFAWSSYEAALREAWAGLDISWRDALRQGGYWDLSGSGRRERPASLTDDETQAETVPEGDDPILHVYSSTPLGDGRHAHLPYLQELSDPITGVRWGSVVEIASERALSLGIESGDLVELTGGAGTLTAEAFVTPGIHPDVVAVAAGQGHGAYGRYATGRGVNAFTLLDGGLTRVRLRKVTA